MKIDRIKISAILAHKDSLLPKTQVFLFSHQIYDLNFALTIQSKRGIFGSQKATWRARIIFQSRLSGSSYHTTLHLVNLLSSLPYQDLNTIWRHWDAEESF